MKRKKAPPKNPQATKKRNTAVHNAVFRNQRALIPASLVAKRNTGATEVKSVDLLESTFPFNNTAPMVVFNIPLEGASFYNRIGRRIRMKSLHFRCKIMPSNNNATALPQPVILRQMIIYDRQCNGAFPALADILTAYSNAGTTSSQPLDGLNMNNRDRFEILLDNQVILPAMGINGASPASTVLNYTSANEKNSGEPQGQINMNRFIKLRGLETHFKASAGAIGDIATG